MRGAGICLVVQETRVENMYRSQRSLASVTDSEGDERTGCRWRSF